MNYLSFISFLTPRLDCISLFDKSNFPLVGIPMRLHLEKRN